MTSFRYDVTGDIIYIWALTLTPAKLGILNNQCERIWYPPILPILSPQYRSHVPMTTKVKIDNQNVNRRQFYSYLIRIQIQNCSPPKNKKYP